MPYISRASRERIDPALQPLLDLVTAPTASVGSMNYIISRLIDHWTVQQGVSYKVCNAAMGILTGVQSEFYLRRVTPYERDARMRNGDIFPEIDTP